MRIVSIAIAIFLSGVGAASAGFQSWSAESEPNPFNEKKSVTVSYLDSGRSGVFLLCDGGTGVLTVRAIPGFAYSMSLAIYEPTMRFAVDGKVVGEAKGETGSVGDNLAMSQAELDGDLAHEFIDAFIQGKSQIAVDSGIADRPQLLKARGSTNSGKALRECLSSKAATATGDEPNSQKMLAENKCVSSYDASAKIQADVTALVNCLASISKQ